MKAMGAGSKTKCKSISINWKQIVVELEDDVFIYDLTENERLMNKMERQKKRSLKKSIIAQQAQQVPQIQQAQQNPLLQFHLNRNDSSSTQNEVITSNANQAASIEEGADYEIFDSYSLVESDPFFMDNYSIDQAGQDFLNSTDWAHDGVSIFDFSI